MDTAIIRHTFAVKHKPDPIKGVRMSPEVIAKIKATVPLNRSIRNFSEQVRHVLETGLECLKRRDSKENAA